MITPEVGSRALQDRFALSALTDTKLGSENNGGCGVDGPHVIVSRSVTGNGHGGGGGDFAQ